MVPRRCFGGVSLVHFSLLGGSLTRGITGYMCGVVFGLWVSLAVMVDGQYKQV